MRIRGRSRRVRAVMAAALAAGLALTGCTVGSTGPEPGVPAPLPGASGSGVAGPAELARFYGQSLTWERCAGTAETQCAWVEVPLDYSAPTGRTIKVRMLRLPARGGKASRGTLFVNPGGPGGSATEYASYGDLIVTAQIRRNFDIVGVDPRGVARSSPIVCVPGAQLDQVLAYDPTPDDAAERAEMTRLARDFGQACQRGYPDLLGHVSTVEVARDMDIARALVGDQRLSYLGKSYGTFLGATYAGLFPGTVGRMVLDGAVAPDLTDEQMNLGQAEGFERATRAYVADCVAQGGCPLGADLESGMTGLRALLTKLDAQPLPVRGDPRVTQLTEGWGSLAVAQTMYEQGTWQSLTDALRQAYAGDGTALFQIASRYARRNASGEYTSNLLQVISAVNCLDRGGQVLTDAERERLTKEFTAKAPTWGRFMVYGSVTCSTWPVKPTGTIAPITAKGSPPILVVGTTRDPATPYGWAAQLAEQLANGRLLTFDGDGHTAYLRGSNCVDRAVDQFLMDGTVPAEGARC